MKYAPYAFATLVVALSTAWTIAQECCVTCGCGACVRKVCHLKCETKKVPHTEYCCECEDFCVPGPSKKCGQECTVDCHGCERCKTKWIPQCAEVHTRHKLKKIVTEKEEKSYKWVVETLCDGCAARCVTSEQQLRQTQIVGTPVAPVASPEGGSHILPASFNIPDPIMNSGPTANARPAPTTSRSWRDSFKLPWQR